MTYLLNCRARISPDCEHGAERPNWQHDGTYRVTRERDAVTPFRDSIICNACYVYLMPFTPSGHALLHELDDAVASVRKRQKASPS